MDQNVDVFALLLPEIQELLREKDFVKLKQLLNKRLHPMDIAEGFKHLSDPEMVISFKLLGQKRAIEVFESLSLEDREYLLNNLNNQEAADILNEIAADERAELFRELPQPVMEKFMSLIRKPEAEEVKRILKYPEDTAGGLMTAEFVELKKDMTARRAVLHLQKEYHPGMTETIYSVYVTDTDHKLKGLLTLQMLITAKPDMFIGDIMNPVDVIKAPAELPKEEVVNMFVKYDLSDLPVVDTDGRLLGIIQVDDIIDEINKIDAATMYEIGKMTPGDGEEIIYGEAGIFDLVKRRAGWLILLLVFDFLTGTVLKTFQHALSSVVALAFFIPMLLGTGGNAGTQTAITIIRGLATGDVTFKNARRIIGMEITASLLMGMIVGAVAFVRAFMLLGDPVLSTAVGVTMLALVMLAISTGIFLPLLAKKIGLDPAALAGPLTTSIVDVIGLIIYFSIAKIFIPQL